MITGLGLFFVTPLDKNIAFNVFILGIKKFWLGWFTQKYANFESGFSFVCGNSVGHWHEKFRFCIWAI